MKGRKKSRPLPVLPPCKVCGEPGAGFHYGVTTCVACKGFFGRSVTRTQPYECHKGPGRCPIGPEGERKRICPKCRLEKCFEVGMSKDAIKTGRYSYEKKSKDIYEMLHTKGTTGKQESSHQASAEPYSDRKESIDSGTFSVGTGDAADDDSAVLHELSSLSFQGENSASEPNERSSDSHTDKPTHNKPVNSVTASQPEKYQLLQASKGHPDQVSSTTDSNDPEDRSQNSSSGSKKFLPEFSTLEIRNRPDLTERNIYLPSMSYTKVNETLKAALKRKLSTPKRSTRDTQAHAEKQTTRSSVDNENVSSSDGCFSEMSDEEETGYDVHDQTLSEQVSENEIKNGGTGYERANLVNSHSNITLKNGNTSDSNLSPPNQCSRYKSEALELSGDAVSTFNKADHTFRPAAASQFPDETGASWKLGTWSSQHLMRRALKRSASPSSPDLAVTPEMPPTYHVLTPVRGSSVESRTLLQSMGQPIADYHPPTFHQMDVLTNPSGDVEFSLSNGAASNLENAFPAKRSMVESASFVPIHPGTDSFSHEHSTGEDSNQRQDWHWRQGHTELNMTQEEGSECASIYSTIESSPTYYSSGVDDFSPKPPKSPLPVVLSAFEDSDFASIHPGAVMTSCCNKSPKTQADYEAIRSVVGKDKSPIQMLTIEGSELNRSVTVEEMAEDLKELGTCELLAYELVLLRPLIEKVCGFEPRFHHQFWDKKDTLVDHMVDRFRGSMEGKSTPLSWCEFSEEELDDVMFAVKHSHQRHLGLDINNMPPAEVQRKRDLFMKILRLKNIFFGDKSFCDYETYFSIFDNTGIDVDGRKAYWERTIKVQEKMMYRYIKFFKMIPGFKNLCEDDKVTLIRHSYCTCRLLSYYKAMDHERKIVVNECDIAFQLDEISLLFKSYGQLMEQFFEAGKMLDTFDLTLDEIILLKAIMVTAPECGGLQESEKIEKVHWRLHCCLILSLIRNRPAPRQMYARIVSMLQHLRTLTAFRDKCFYKYISDLQKLKPNNNIPLYEELIMSYYTT